MDSNSLRKPAIFAFVEVCLLLGACLVFLSGYAARASNAGDITLAHLELVGAAWLGMVSLRLAIWCWTPTKRLPILLAAALTAAFFIVLLGYYVAVLAGLDLWGRVISWPLIRSYAAQWADLSSALGLSPTVIGVSAVLVAASVVAVLMWAVMPSDWARWIAGRHRARLVSALAIGGLCFAALRIFGFAELPEASSGEPLALTFFPEQAALKRQSSGESRLQSHSAIDPALAHYSPSADAQRRNVVLIVGDALRSDRMSVYGHGNPTTPYLDALAADGKLRYARHMRSICAESFCGLMALETSRFVHHFSAPGLTLHEVLRRHGYGVHMILGGDHTNFYGLKEAYGPVDSYHDGSESSGYMNDDQLVIDRVKLLPRWDGVPQFFQFHLMSTHGLGKRHDRSMKFSPWANYYAKGWLGSDPATLQERARNYYDNGMFQFDSVVAELMRLLDERGYLANTLVVITGDHGELLGEHGQYAHGTTIHEEALRVPLILLNFGYQWTNDLASNPLASQIDVAPTILHELAMPAPPGWDGAALQRPTERDVLFVQQGAQVALFDPDRAAGPWKYWVDYRAGTERVFDLASDPGEERDVFQTIDRATRGKWKLQIAPASATVVVINTD